MMKRFRPLLVLFIATTTLIAQQQPPAATTSIADQIAANRKDLRLENGKLSGNGAAVVTDALKDAQFVFLGEDHGISQVAQLADALYSELQPLGFNTVALEVGPYTAKELSEVLATKDAVEMHRRFIVAHPMSVPFYNTQEEFAFLQHARALGGERFHIIGFDQELMGVAGLLLEQVARQKLPPDLYTAVFHLQQDEERAKYKAQASGNPLDLYMMKSPIDQLTSVAQKLKAAHLDATPITNLLASRHIYELYTQGKGYENNVERSLLMRRYFHQQYPEGSHEKVFFKAGGEHAFKGVNPLRNRDLGNHIAELAEGRGEHSVHILVIAAGGEQLMFGGAGKPMQPSPITIDEKDPLLMPFKALTEEAVKHDGWSLIDLRPLRPQLRKLHVDPELDRVVLGFDFAVVFPRAVPSHEIQ